MHRIRLHRGDTESSELYEEISVEGSNSSPSKMKKKYNAVNKLTLEGLRNISNPMSLFTKEDEQRFTRMLGIDLDEEEPLPIVNKSPLK